METAFFLNGVFEHVLREIMESCSTGRTSIGYLQPRSTGVIRYLEKESPSPEKPITGYFTTTKRLAEVTYQLEIIRWEDKRELSGKGETDVEKAIQAFQPSENGLLLKNDKGKKCVNLMTVRNIVKLNHPFPVTNLIKVSNREPLRVRKRSGGQSTVFLLPL